MADRYFVAGGVDNNWGTTGNWSLTSGGAGGQAVPTNADDVFLDGNSPNCTVNASNRVCRQFDANGYTNTLTMTFNITATPQSTGIVRFAAGMAFAGSGIFSISGASSGTHTITSAGVAITCGFGISGSATTFTLADNFNVDGTLFLGISNGIATINGNQINAGGSLTVSGTTGTYGGTTALVIDGTGTWSSSGGQLRLNTTINTAGTLTISGTVQYDTGTLTYTAGTVVTTGSTLAMATGCTLAVSGITWNNVSTFGSGGGGTFTLSEDLTMSGTFTVSKNLGTTATFNGSTIEVGGSLSLGITNMVLAGTSVVLMNGTGSITTTGAASIRTPLTINTSGTITLVGTVNYAAATLTYTAGTVVGGSSVTVAIPPTGTTTVLDLNGLVLDASLTITRTGATQNNVTLASGMTILAGRTVTIQGNSGSQLTTLASNSGGTQRVFTLQAGVVMSIRYNATTDIDSSGGQLVLWRKPGSVTNTLNWGEITGGAGGGGKGGGGVGQFIATGARGYNIGNMGVSIISNS